MLRLLLVSACLALPSNVLAATLFAATNGSDGAACGASASPCRSISAAIAHAVAGDKVVVRPGVYSDDLDLDGNVGEPGEEPGAINVNKAIAVESTGGAAATLIRKVSVPSGVVDVTASNAKFGRVSRGFTVKLPGGVNSTGVSVINSSGVVVAGNVLVGPINFGIGVTGSDPEIRDNRVICTSGAGGIGVILLPAPGARLDRNSVEGCGSGYVGAGAGMVITRNLAIDSVSSGFSLTDFASFTKNAAIGNRQEGLVLNSGGSLGVLTGNAFIGNGTAGNCGIRNNSGTTVTATGNYWGAATGPGADPADQTCDGPGSVTVTTPFSTTDSTPTQSPLR